jgi:hypothetical protein
MEFLGDRGFTRVRTDYWCFHREEHRKGGELGIGINGIAKTYIDLQRNSSSSQLGLKLDAYAIVFVLFFDPRSPLLIRRQRQFQRLAEFRKFPGSVLQLP